MAKNMIQKQQQVLENIQVITLVVITSIMMKHYIKRKQESFFLYGEGGPASKYAQKTIGGYTGGKEIIPLTEKDAKEWAEERLDCDEYEALFGEVEE